MKENTIVRIISILCLTAIEIVNAFITKYDNYIMMIVVFAIGSIAGAKMDKLFEKVKRKNA